MERDEKRDYLISLRESTGMTRKDFAIEYDIPYPTITDWELGHRRIPEYFLRLLAYHIGQQSKDCRFVNENMVILITGASHTGKTNLAQKLLEKYHFPYVSQDHIKMGLIRSGNTTLTPEDDDKLTDYLWPITREMVKTAIENHQNLIIEGCYMPFDWKKDFEEEYLEKIQYICLAFGKNYIEKNFNLIKENALCIEHRLDDNYYTTDDLIADNSRYIEGCRANNLHCDVITDNYENVIESIVQRLSM